MRGVFEFLANQQHNYASRKRKLRSWSMVRLEQYLTAISFQVYGINELSLVVVMQGNSVYPLGWRYLVILGASLVAVSSML